jgi:quercetin dioxygenase-like cupin family protein
MSFLPLNLDRPVVRAAQTVTADLGVLGVRFITDAGPTGGRFSLVEHPIAARGLAAPMHRHGREDEYSFILEGRWGFQLGDTVVYGEPGDLVYKPRGVWHSFWNATDAPARLLEIISPAGFEHYFAEAAALREAGQVDEARVRELMERYALEIDMDSLPALVAAHDLVLS